MDSLAENDTVGYVTSAPITPATAAKRNQSGLLSRNLVVGGRRTSARLEPEMWAAFYDISRREHRSIHDISTLVNQNRPVGCTLTAALRVFIMAYFRAAATEEGHARAGHGYGKVIYQTPRPRA